jgi:hypothetical protein
MYSMPHHGQLKTSRIVKPNAFWEAGEACFVKALVFVEPFDGRSNGINYYAMDSELDRQRVCAFFYS